jgi:hypothetical protein
MTSVDSIVESVIDSMTLDLDVYAVTVISGNYKLWATNTHYLGKNSIITLSAVDYTVVSFVQNSYLIVSGASSPAPGTYALRKPQYIYGKYLQVQQEIGKKHDKDILPMIWRFDLASRTSPTARDSVNESEGSSRFFFMATNNPKEYTTESDYDNVLNPLNSLADTFLTALGRNNRVNTINGVTRVNYSKFTNGGNSTTTDTSQKVFNKNISAVEVTVPLNIIKDFTCRVREIPLVDGNGFSIGFSTGFK